LNRTANSTHHLHYRGIVEKQSTRLGTEISKTEDERIQKYRDNNEIQLTATDNEDD